ncbi:MAG: hypothetical protein WBB41_13225, partial [Candidatus Nanopelagicales bacterium]
NTDRNFARLPVSAFRIAAMINAENGGSLFNKSRDAMYEYLLIGYARGDCRLQAAEESGNVAALRYNRWSGDALTSRSRPHL